MNSKRTLLARVCVLVALALSVGSLSACDGDGDIDGVPILPDGGLVDGGADALDAVDAPGPDTPPLADAVDAAEDGGADGGDAANDSEEADATADLVDVAPTDAAGDDAGDADGADDTGDTDDDALDAELPGSCDGREGEPCDDGQACTVDDTCTDGACVGLPRDARCDDGDPCTTDRCEPEKGGCTSEPATGPSCGDALACEEGRCVDGECVLFPNCDDGVLCTEDACDPDEGCVHTPAEPLWRPAPDFTLFDRNPRSATFGQPVTLADWQGKVAVLLFHDALCESCLVMGEGARSVHARYAEEPELLFASVNGLGSEDFVEDYVSYDGDGEPPLETLWPVLQDVAPVRLWVRYCAESNDVFVVGRTGEVVYNRAVNFADQNFRLELRRAIDAELYGN